MNKTETLKDGTKVVIRNFTLDDYDERALLPRSSEKGGEDHSQDDETTDCSTEYLSKTRISRRTPYSELCT